jgi:hypothetical protein
VKVAHGIGNSQEVTYSSVSGPMPGAMVSGWSCMALYLMVVIDAAKPSILTDHTFPY